MTQSFTMKHSLCSFLLQSTEVLTADLWQYAMRTLLMLAQLPWPTLGLEGTNLG